MKALQYLTIILFSLFSVLIGLGQINSDSLSKSLFNDFRKADFMDADIRAYLGMHSAKDSISVLLVLDIQARLYDQMARKSQILINEYKKLKDSAKYITMVNYKTLIDVKLIEYPLRVKQFSK